MQLSVRNVWESIIGQVATEAANDQRAHGCCRTGFGQPFKLIGSVLPPPAGVRPPDRGAAACVVSGAAIETTPREFNFRYRSAAHWMEVFRTYYGPVHRAFLALDPAAQATLERGMLDLLAQFDRGGGPGWVVPSEYLEVVLRPSQGS